MKTFRNRSYLYLGSALMLAGMALLLVPVAAGEAIALILTAPIGLAWLPVGWFMLVRPRIIAGAAGVTIVNRRKTVHLKWADIERFAPALSFDNNSS